VRHELHTGRHLDPDDIRSGLTRVSDKHREPKTVGGNAANGFQSMFFRQDRSESVFTRLVNTKPSRFSPYLSAPGRSFTTTRERAFCLIKPRTDLIFFGTSRFFCHPTFGRHLSYQCMRRRQYWLGDPYGTG